MTPSETVEKFEVVRLHDSMVEKLTVSPVDDRCSLRLHAGSVLRKKGGDIFDPLVRHAPALLVIDGVHELGFEGRYQLNATIVDNAAKTLPDCVHVEFTFVLKDGQTGEELWRNNQAMVYQPQSQGGGVADLIANLIISAIERAAPNYIPLARQANHLAVLTPGQGIPAGPYAEKYLKDYDNFNSAIKLKPNPAESKKPGI